MRCIHTLFTLFIPLSLCCFCMLFPSSFLYSQIGLEMVNGQFENGTGGWTLKRTTGTAGSVSIDGNSVLSGRNSLLANISRGGTSLNAVRLLYALRMTEGRCYDVSFYAKSNRPCTMQAGIHSNINQLGTFWSSQPVTVGESPQRYGPFPCHYLNSDSVHIFSFLFGGTDSLLLWIDSVSIFMTDDPDHQRGEELSANRFIDTMQHLSASTDNRYLKLHYEAMSRVAESKLNLLTYDYTSLDYLFTMFTDTNHANSPRNLSSYADRKRPYIVSWISPTDGKTSFALLISPKNWNPEETYPLYVSLHGLWPVADNPIDFMSYNFLDGLEENEPFENGYLIFPWGRGNIWYEGIGETDVWESIHEVESIVKVDPKRKYLLGFSMGGYGAWYIGQKSPDVWAALGIYAGALNNGGYPVVDLATAEKLKNVPTYFVVGDQDGFQTIDTTAYELLRSAGNTNLFFTKFSGGHEYQYNNLNTLYLWIKNFVNERRTGIQELPGSAPTQFNLFNNYPNPFNPSTVIRYQLSSPSMVELKIIDLLGRELKTLVNGEQPAGTYQWNFDGSRLSSGIYLCRISARESRLHSNQAFVKTNKMILLK
jgi:predicted esterase